MRALGGVARQRPTVFIARGDAFPDAIPEATADVIDDLDIRWAYIVGGESAVSGPVKSEIDVMLVANGGTASERWAGTSRYDTARVVAEKGVEAGFVSWDYAGVATGEKFPDALAGGVAAGSNYGVIALTGSGLPTGEDCDRRCARLVEGSSEATVNVTPASLVGPAGVTRH